MNEHPTEILTFAAESSLRYSGQRNAAEMVREVSSFSPARAFKVKKAYTTPPKPPRKYTPEKALALYVEGKFTKGQYIAIQSGAKLHGANIYPPYHVLKMAKKDHTIMRLVKVQRGCNFTKFTQRNFRINSNL